MVLCSDLGCHTLWFLAYSIHWKWVKYSPQLRGGEIGSTFWRKEFMGIFENHTVIWYILEWLFSFLTTISIAQINTSCTCNFQIYCLKTKQYRFFTLLSHLWFPVFLLRHSIVYTTKAIVNFQCQTFNLPYSYLLFHQQIFECFLYILLGPENTKIRSKTGSLPPGRSQSKRDPHV